MTITALDVFIAGLRRELSIGDAMMMLEIADDNHKTHGCALVVLFLLNSTSDRVKGGSTIQKRRSSILHNNQESVLSLRGNMIKTASFPLVRHQQVRVRCCCEEKMEAAPMIRTTHHGLGRVVVPSTSCSSMMSPIKPVRRGSFINMAIMGTGSDVAIDLPSIQYGYNNMDDLIGSNHNISPPTKPTRRGSLLQATQQVHLVQVDDNVNDNTSKATSEITKVARRCGSLLQGNQVCQSTPIKPVRRGSFISNLVGGLQQSPKDDSLCSSPCSKDSTRDCNLALTFVAAKRDSSILSQSSESAARIWSQISKPLRRESIIIKPDPLNDTTEQTKEEDSCSDEAVLNARQPIKTNDIDAAAVGSMVNNTNSLNASPSTPTKKTPVRRASLVKALGNLIRSSASISDGSESEEEPEDIDDEKTMPNGKGTFGRQLSTSTKKNSIRRGSLPFHTSGIGVGRTSSATHSSKLTRRGSFWESVRQPSKLFRAAQVTAPVNMEVACSVVKLHDWHQGS